MRDKLPGRPRPATAAGWTTVKKDGTTEWIPVPDRGQRRTNTYFPPEKMLPDDEDDGDWHRDRSRRWAPSTGGAHRGLQL